MRSNQSDRTMWSNESDHNGMTCYYINNNSIVIHHVPDGINPSSPSDVRWAIHPDLRSSGKLPPHLTYLVRHPSSPTIPGKGTSLWVICGGFLFLLSFHPFEKKSEGISACPYSPWSFPSGWAYLISDLVGFPGKSWELAAKEVSIRANYWWFLLLRWKEIEVSP